MQCLASVHKKAGTCDGRQETLLSRGTSLQEDPCRFYAFLASQREDVGKKPVTGTLVPDNAPSCAVHLVERDPVGADEDGGLSRGFLE